MGRAMTKRAAVIGAGLAGAACARGLKEAGWDVEVLEAADDPGGRTGARETMTPRGHAWIDHGAPYLTARSEAFSATIRRWIAAGAAEPWDARLVTIDERGVSKELAALAYTGKPGMSALVLNDLESVTVRTGARVVAIRGEPDLYRVMFDDGAERGFYHAVAVAIPAEPAAALLDQLAPFQASAARRVRTQPCWAAMAAFPEPIDAPYDGAAILKGPISWVARESSKPGRGRVETWSIHAAPGWSYEFEALRPEEAGPRLVEAFRRRLKAPAPIWCSAHFWRHASVERAVGSPFGWDQASKIGSCGDWYMGSRAELAWQSGAGLAEAIIEDFALASRPIVRAN
jgi:predicted NAD/FAD-dependent oxidoreductase